MFSFRSKQPPKPSVDAAKEGVANLSIAGDPKPPPSTEAPKPPMITPPPAPPKGASQSQKVHSIDGHKARLSSLEAAERKANAAEKAVREAEERMMRLSKVSATPPPRAPMGASQSQKVIQVLETAEHPPPSACVLLIIGECGDGKSTLVNALRDPARSEEAKWGKATRGVTKTISVFDGKPIKGRAIQIMDTPGIGDQDVTPLSLVAMIEAKLSDHPIPISGVIVTTPATEVRFKLGAQVVQTLVEHGFVGEHKWDSVILVGTKSDRADEEEKAFFRGNVVKDFFGKAPPGTSPKFALTTKQDVSQLVTQIGSLPGFPIEYVQPGASFAQILAAKLGIPEEAFSTAFDQFRDQLARQQMAQFEKERRELEQMARQAAAAAEAKSKVETAELARQVAALQEALKRREERFVKARPSTYATVVNGITYLPRLAARAFTPAAASHPPGGKNRT